MKILASIFLALTTTTAFAVSYSFEELHKGIPETRAIDAARHEGLIVTADPRGGGYTVADARNHEVVAQLWVCSGRLYGYSQSATGGPSAFVKRVAQFNTEFGLSGNVAATSKMESFGEVNTIEITWEKDWRTVSLTYTPNAPAIEESQWIRFSVPRACSGK